MLTEEYIDLIKSIRPSKRLGQNFLVDRGVAKTEANFGIGRNVLELGPGLGMLTGELCKCAKSVTAIERDRELYDYLKSSLRSAKLTLINDDFFNAQRKKAGADIMIANIPYNLSSRVVGWLGEMQMPAVLCLQKEFVNHMEAKPGTKNYSKLSVFCALRFSVTRIIDVPPSCFYPEPRVSSSVVYLKPKGIKIKKTDYELLSLLMMHKKKTLRKALIDSRKALGKKEAVTKIADSLSHKDRRIFQMDPTELLEISREIQKGIRDLQS